MHNEYLNKISSIVKSEGIRDTYIMKNRLKELNKLHPSDVIIYESDNKRGKCTIYYGSESDSALIRSYEFKLGKVHKNKRIDMVLLLDHWEEEFNQKIRKKKPTPDEIKSNISKWVKKNKNNCELEVVQFLKTLMVYYRFTGQITVVYREFNGELQKIKPIIRLHKPVTVEQLHDFGRSKSLELWNREFTCNIEMTKTYWKQQLGTYTADLETITFSEYQNALLTQEKIYDTMLHEMVHWHLHTSGRNYHDEDFEFIGECLRVGCGLSQGSSERKAFVDYKKKKGVG